MPNSDMWIRMVVPPSMDMIQPVQQTVSSLAGRCGFDAVKRNLIEMAVEDLAKTIFHYAFDDGKITEGEMIVEVKVDPPFFRVNIIEHGLPFDFSMVTEMKDDVMIGDDISEAGLAVYLIKRNADHYNVLHNGREGVRFEQAWFLPCSHINDIREEDESSAAVDEKLPPEKVEDVRLLDDSFAIQIARLVFRGYGYSYVYADIYYPERVCSYFRSGLLKSFGVVTGSGRLVGHLALMKDSEGTGALEWGVAVVDPQWRGMGLMERMLRRAMACADESEEKILFAHAVTAHPYTQKTCCRFGFQPVALLLCYAPATMEFKGIGDSLKQRESTFLAARCTHPLPRQKLYLPSWHAPTLKKLLAALEPALPDDLLCDADENMELELKTTDYTVSTALCINAGRVQVSAVGADCGRFLRNTTRKLCNERVDVIYLTVDLADPGAAKLVRYAEQAGFFIAGITPMMRPAYGLTLQFLNCGEVDFSKIHAHGEMADWLKETVKNEKMRVDTL